MFILRSRKSHAESKNVCIIGLNQRFSHLQTERFRAGAWSALCGSKIKTLSCLWLTLGSLRLNVSGADYKYSCGFMSCGQKRKKERFAVVYCILVYENTETGSLFNFLSFTLPPRLILPVWGSDLSPKLRQSATDRPCVRFITSPFCLKKSFEILVWPFSGHRIQRYWNNPPSCLACNTTTRTRTTRTSLWK